mgnify:FL=1
MTNETFKYRKRRKPESAGKTKRRVSTKITGHEFRAVSLGWDIALPIFAGPLFGVWLDHKFGREGVFVLILLGAGVILAVVQVCRAIHRESIWTREEERENRE